MIPLPFLVACGVLVSFMISIKAFYKWRNIESGEEEIIGKYAERNINLRLLSKRIQNPPYLQELLKIKVKIITHDKFKEQIIAKRKSLSYQDMVEVTITGEPNNFTVSGDFGMMRSVMTNSFSTWTPFEQQRKVKNLKNRIIIGIDYILRDMA
jgi:hypothetical protein